jgi:predicted N-acetyltransferase YhbS
MDIPQVLQRLDAERRGLAREGETLEVLPHLTRVAARGGHHWVAFSSLMSANPDAVIAEQAAHYRARAAEVEWKVYGHDRPHDLRARLARHGFEAGETEAVLALDLHDRAAWITDPPAHEVRRVSDEGQLRRYRAAAETIFGKDYGYVTDEIAQGIREGSTEHLGFVAVQDGAAVSVGRLYTHPLSAFGGLYGGGTLETHRGRGLYRAVVAARAREAAALGARYLIVDAMPTSRPILERLGFVRLTETWPCTLRPS